MKQHGYALLLSAFLVGIVTLALMPIHATLGTSGLAMSYLMLVLVVSIYARYRTALMTGVLSFLALNFFFVAPRYTFQVDSVNALLELVVFLAVAMTTASLTAKLKTQTFQAEQAKMHVQSAQALAQELLKLTHTDAVLARASGVMARVLDARIILAQRKQGEVTVVMDTEASTPFTIDLMATHWCLDEQQAIGPDTGNWESFDYWCIPLQALEQVQMVIFICPKQLQALQITPLSFIRGLVDQVNLALELLVAREQERLALSLAERESVQNALLASLSHDFRTPLTAIVGAASHLLAQTAEQDTNHRQLLTMITEEATQMVDDADNILALTRVETQGKSALSADWQSVEELIGIVVSRCRHRHVQLKLVTQVAPSLPFIWVDARLVIQALINLVDNALKFDASGSAIILSAAQREQWLWLSVRDHGEGLSQDKQSFLKSKFSRGQTESAQPGFGLGLAICDAVAQVHGGKLVLENAPDGGLVATLMLPVSIVTEA